LEYGTLAKPARSQIVSLAMARTQGVVMRFDVKSFLIGALLVAVVAFGYLYWERQRNTIEIKLPSISIDKR